MLDNFMGAKIIIRTVQTGKVKNFIFRGEPEGKSPEADQGNQVNEGRYAVGLFNFPISPGVDLWVRSIGPLNKWHQIVQIFILGQSQVTIYGHGSSIGAHCCIVACNDGGIK